MKLLGNTLGSGKCQLRCFRPCCGVGNLRVLLAQNCSLTGPWCCARHHVGRTWNNINLCPTMPPSCHTAVARISTQFSSPLQVAKPKVSSQSWARTHVGKACGCLKRQAHGPPPPRGHSVKPAPQGREGGEGLPWAVGSSTAGTCQQPRGARVPTEGSTESASSAGRPARLHLLVQGPRTLAASVTCCLHKPCPRCSLGGERTEGSADSAGGRRQGSRQGRASRPGCAPSTPMSRSCSPASMSA